MNDEAISLGLVQDIQEELRNALNSLGGTRSNGLLDKFRVLLARHINSAADGYISLRKTSKVDASKLVIRPTIEAAIKILAVQHKSELLFRFVHTERTEDRKLYRRLASNPNDYDLEDAMRWEDFKRQYQVAFPDHTLQEKEISLCEAATAAGLAWHYDFYYRLYCIFTHARLAATDGSLDFTDPEDNPQMAAAVLCALEAVQSAGGVAPNAPALRRRLASLVTKQRS